MQLRRDIVLPVTTLVVLNVLLAFGAIGLFMRIAPAVERVLHDNVATIEAAEQMLHALATRETAGAQDAEKRFAEALSTAKQRITEQGEREALAQIEAHYRAALTGEPGALTRVTSVLARLSELNHAAMRRMNMSAQRLAQAGAWAAVFVALLSLALNGLVLRMLDQRVALPVREIANVLEAAHSGDIFRRCRDYDAPAELRRALQSINEMLDERTGGITGAPRRVQHDAVMPAERAALTKLLDEKPEPAVVLNARGEVVAANLRAMDLLGAEGGESLRTALLAFASGQSDERIQGVPLSDTGGQLCTLRP